jgi:hypothetical protein
VDASGIEATKLASNAIAFSSLPVTKFRLFKASYYACRNEMEEKF